MEDIRIIKTKETLFDTLLHLLDDNSFDRITVSKLCKEARVNRSTFYAHYKNINELFEEHFESVLMMLKKEYTIINERLLTLESDSMIPLYKHILNHKKIYDVILSGHAPISYLMRFQVALGEYKLEIMDRTLPKGMEPILYYSFFVGAIYGMIVYWRSVNYKFTPEEMGVHTITFLQNQILGSARNK